MKYRALPRHLHPCADAVVRFFDQERGITNFRVEESVRPDLPYRPTLSRSQAVDLYDIWIEVAEKPWADALDEALLHCIRNCMPVQIYVASPVDSAGPEYSHDAKKARQNGVGIIEFLSGQCLIAHEARPLSLLGVRQIVMAEFPKRLRSSLAGAEQTFRNGDPAKGCSLVYDEIENLTRRLADRVSSKGWWKLPRKGKISAKRDWMHLIDDLLNDVDYKLFPKHSQKSTRDSLTRVAALRPHRNESAHKLTSRSDRLKRDRELRTRFENATDVLRDLATALRPLHI